MLFRFCYSNGTHLDLVASDIITAFEYLSEADPFSDEPLFAFTHVLKCSNGVWKEV